MPAHCPGPLPVRSLVIITQHWDTPCRARGCITFSASGSVRIHYPFRCFSLLPFFLTEILIMLFYIHFVTLRSCTFLFCSFVPFFWCDSVLSTPLIVASSSPTLLFLFALTCALIGAPYCIVHALESLPVRLELLIISSTSPFLCLPACLAGGL